MKFESLKEFLERSKHTVEIMESKEIVDELEDSEYNLEDLANDMEEVAKHIENNEFDKILNY